MFCSSVCVGVGRWRLSLHQIHHNNMSSLCSMVNLRKAPPNDKTIWRKGHKNVSLFFIYFFILTVTFFCSSAPPWYSQPILQHHQGYYTTIYPPPDNAEHHLLHHYSACQEDALSAQSTTLQSFGSCEGLFYLALNSQVSNQSNQTGRCKTNHTRHFGFAEVKIDSCEIDQVFLELPPSVGFRLF